ncbi:MAG: YidC/Oxa1 family membrane protein insertase, partial [Treponemataceae bacterium]|nr:YidC/Oxa1 family membrane protein insertase [Treponemataceae bacterium]
NGYHPLMALRSSFGLLIQIPFFMAAYNYLSNLEELRGLSFWFIRDLGNPDATFYIGSFAVNVLPIAMTLINCISGAIYTKGFKAKDKIQIYAMAAIFLVILYDSPAGLVLYWTMNNVFSMVKNIFYKLKKPLFVLYLCACAGVCGIDYYLFFEHNGFLYKRLAIVFLLAIVFFIPLLVKLVQYLLDTLLKPLVDDEKACFSIFLSSSLVLSIVCGLYIVTTIIAASPMEFSFIDDITSPFTFLWANCWKFFGLFCIWPLCVYLLFGRRIKACISALFAMGAIVVLINVFVFHGNYGNLNQTMIFDNPGALRPATGTALLNIFAGVAAIALVCVVFAVKKTVILSRSYGIIAVALAVTSFLSFGGINRNYTEYAAMQAAGGGSADTVKPVFHFSKTEKNIFILDLDRAISAYLPEIFRERPELNDIFEGFVYYPNTVSFGVNTLAASPAMFGGYDYTPQMMNARDTEALVDKHNEALKVLPVLFMNNGYTATVTDSSFAGYSWIPDMRIFDEYPEIRALTTEKVYRSLWMREHPGIRAENYTSRLIGTNIFWYTVLRASPSIMRDLIYKNGNYWSSLSDADSIQTFVDSYSVLDYLPRLTDFSSEKPTFTYMVNDATHEPLYLQAPDYVPVKTVTDIGQSRYARDRHYHINISSFLELAEWFQFLKENGVYDNTRIILVSDHGSSANTDELPSPSDGVTNNRIESINPILLVKDFGASGAITRDETFMTNADVAALACENIIENPVNPFTGNPIDMKRKAGGIFGALLMRWTPDGQEKNKYRVEFWYKTGESVFDADCVREVTEEEAMASLPN